MAGLGLGPEPTWTDALLARFNQFFEEADCILLSSKNAEGGYLDHWSEMARKFPRNSPFAFAHRIFEMHRVVFSKSGRKVTGLNVEMATRPLAAEVAALKKEQGANIVAFGGAGFAAALIAEGLIDEFQFYINQVASLATALCMRRGADAQLRNLFSTGDIRQLIFPVLVGSVSWPNCI